MAFLTVLIIYGRLSDWKIFQPVENMLGVIAIPILFLFYYYTLISPNYVQYGFYKDTSQPLNSTEPFTCALLNTWVSVSRFCSTCLVYGERRPADSETGPQSFITLNVCTQISVFLNSLSATERLNLSHWNYWTSNE